jgi:acyl-CoA reductase-like NAD-dependent aldehyde dehydrogenase
MSVRNSDNWATRPLGERIRIVCALRHALAHDPQPFLDALKLPFRRSETESLAAEIIPLADACAFLEKSAAKILRPRRLGIGGCPTWLLGTEAEVHREPLGTVLIIGPGNYPLMLPGIQTVQALVCGNRAVWKPAPGTKAVAQLLADTLVRLGAPNGAIVVLDESPDSIKPWVSQVDKCVLTGSRGAGLAVARELAAHVVPAVMELSGCDPVVVLPDANLALVARCVRFGLEFNGSASCIAPRRLLVHESVADALAQRLRRELETVSALPVSPAMRALLNEHGAAAIRAGANLIVGSLPCGESFGPLVFDHVTRDMKLMHNDVMAPVTSIVRVRSDDEAIEIARDCPYRLGASVFGASPRAREIALRIDAGSVVINDLIVATVDPRLPFGGRAASGFGVTRGAQGLLEMTKIKTISTHKRGPRYHHLPVNETTHQLLRAQLQSAHGANLWGRARSAWRMLGLVREAWKRRPQG